MVYTSHGHHIPDSPMEEERPSRVARCGGPGLCAVCSSETARFAETKLLADAIEKIKMDRDYGHIPVVQASIYHPTIQDAVAVQYLGGSEGIDIATWIERQGGKAVWTPHQPEMTRGAVLSPEIRQSLMILSYLNWVEVLSGWWIVWYPSVGIFTVHEPTHFEKLYKPKE